MAGTNTYLPPQQYVNLVLAELMMKMNLGGLITPFSGDQFVGTKNDTLLYRTKAVTIARDYEFRTRTRPVTFDTIARNELPLTIDQQMTVANRWTDEERKFDMTSFRTEVAAPMAEAMIERFDRKILAALLNAHWAITDLNGSEPATDTDQAALKIALGWKAKLDAAGCPAGGRILALGAKPFTYFAASKSTLAYDKSQALSVYRQGVYGQIANMEIWDGSQYLDENAIIVLHPSWAVLPNAAPENPASLLFSARGSYQGYSARLASQYDINFLSDALVLSTFWGVSEIKDQPARHTATTATNANDGSEKGDIIIEDGKTKFTGFNARGGKGVWTPQS